VCSDFIVKATKEYFTLQACPIILATGVYLVLNPSVFFSPTTVSQPKQSSQFGSTLPHQNAESSTPTFKGNSSKSLSERQHRFLNSPAAQLEGQTLNGQQVLELLQAVSDSVGKKKPGQLLLLGTGVLLSGGLLLLSPSYRQALKASQVKCLSNTQIIENLAVLSSPSKSKDEPILAQYSDQPNSRLSFTDTLFLKLLQLELIQLNHAGELFLNQPL
jgi:hypothetical protein